MKRWFALLLLFSCLMLRAQEDAHVYFKDKPDAAYFLAHPLEMLSQKALDRREKQGIATDEKDVPIHPQYIQTIAGSQGITVMAKSKWLNALHVRGSQEDIHALEAYGFVDHVDFANRALNTGGRSAQPQTINAPDKFMQGETNFDYGAAANQIEMLNGDKLHEQGYTGQGMTIAILDAGFPGVDTAPAFNRLNENGQILGGYDFVGHSANFYSGYHHGTMVLSSMGGYAEGQFAGTAPDASYYLFRTEDSDSENPVEESYWVEAAERADSLGVDVINTSLGYFTYDNPAYSYTYEDIDGQTAFITRGANVAFTRGIICVVSAGNSAATENPHIGAPADSFTALTVGAVDASKVYAYFSSLGPTYDQRVKPDVMAQGVNAALSDENGLTAANGTSFSSPITAGLVACLWQALPDKTNAELLQLIKQSADRYDSPDAQYGYGIPDFSLALRKGQASEGAPFLLYPNPSDGVVSIAMLPEDTIATVVLYNTLGQMVLQAKVSLAHPEFSVQQLSKGIYGYRLEARGRAQSGKLIKQ